MKISDVFNLCSSLDLQPLLSDPQYQTHSHLTHSSVTSFIRNQLNKHKKARELFDIIPSHYAFCTYSIKKDLQFTGRPILILVESKKIIGTHTI